MIRFIDNESSGCDLDTPKCGMTDVMIGRDGAGAGAAKILVAISDDPAAFIAFLRGLKGVRVEVTPTRISVS